jgi:hypothetical protein
VDIINRNHSGIVAAGVLIELGDFAYDIEASTAPEMTLNETYIMYPGELSTVSFRVFAASFQGWNGSSFGAYKVAPMAKGIPRKTGMD